MKTENQIKTLQQLESIYGKPREAAVAKVATLVTPDYQAFIDESPFAVLATVGPEGVDCSPRGDQPGFVRVVGGQTLYLPDRQGNNRVDSLKNIVRDPRVALLFLVPGSGNMLRVIGSAQIRIDDDLLKSFAVNDRPPRSVIAIDVEQVYFQCARAIARSELWNPERHCDPDKIPTPGKILANLTDDRVGGDEYDRKWPQRAKETLW